MPKVKTWWFTAGDGRQIGWLWPEEFEALLASIYGKSWVVEFSKETGIGRSSLYRYRDGTQPIPRHVALIVVQMGAIRAGTEPQPLVADWLPDWEQASARVSDTEPA